MGMWLGVFRIKANSWLLPLAVLREERAVGVGEDSCHRVLWVLLLPRHVALG